MKKLRTRMHSSRCLTSAAVVISLSGGLPRGVFAWGCLPRGLSAQGVSAWGCQPRGAVCLGVVHLLPPDQEADTRPLWTDRHLLKHYLSATTVADCKHMPGCSMVQTQHLFCIKTGSCRAGLVRQGQRSFEGKSFLIARKLNCYGVHICSPSS